MISHIYFDWSGTLSKKHLKKIFLYGPKNKKKSVLFPNIIDLLKLLVKNGYILGIITNISDPSSVFIQSLKDIKIFKYFKGSIICSSDYNFRKPSTKIFNIAFVKDNVKPENTLMIGNQYNTDIIGAKNIGMNWLKV